MKSHRQNTRAGHNAVNVVATAGTQGPDEELSTADHAGYRALPNAPDIQVVGKQLLRSGISAAVNHRSALRDRSRQEFTAKIGIVREEADESLFWLELLRDSGFVKPELLTSLLEEEKEITAIFTTAYQTAKPKKPQ